MADPGIRGVVTDLSAGETEEVIINPGQYVTIYAEPLYVAHEQRHANGTVVLTLRRRDREEADRD